MTGTIRILAAVAALAVTPATGACATLGLDEALYGTPSRSSELSGEVRRVDGQRRALELRDTRGRSTWIRFESGTRVMYQGRRYPPSSLERGDVVTVRVERDRRGGLYTRHIVVRRDARDRYGRGPQVTRPAPRRETLQGTVRRVARDDGRFELRSGNRSVWVTLPARPSTPLRERFRRLRQGEQVRVEGVWVGQRFEVARFR